MSNLRSLRVSKLYQSRKNHYMGYIQVPQIRLQGQWLAQAGINPGDKITVTCINNQLIIAKA